MDACQYKSITGLSNWEGLKSLLVNSTLFSGFRCTDETIVLNCVKVISGTPVVTLKANQIAIILQINNDVTIVERLGTANTWLVTEVPIVTRDVNNVGLSIYGSGGTIGMVCAGSVAPARGCIQVAIFDLY